MLNKNKKSKAALYIGTTLLALFAVIPFLWVLRTSVIPNLVAVNIRQSALIPLGKLTLKPYVEMIVQYNFGLYFKNSIIVSVSATVFALLFAIPGAYGFARYDMPGRQVLFYATVFTLMVPIIVLTIPIYEIFYKLNLLNSLIGIIIALTIFVQPQCLWLLQGFFRDGIPPNIEEAAMMDGTTKFGAFFRVVLPLSMPAIGATALFAFLYAWNNFLWVFILSSDESVRTAPVALHYVMGTDILRSWNTLMAAVIVLILPAMVFYALSQRYVNAGLGGGGL